MNTKRNKDGTTLYERIARVLRQRIVSGQWPVGMTVPTLEQLMQEFDAGRKTVREAMKRLIDEGLVTSHRGLGTFVLDHNASTPAPRDLIKNKKKLDIVLIKTGITHELPKLHFASAPAKKYLRIQKIHRLDAEPTEYMDLYTAHKFAKKLTDAKLKKHALNELLFDNLFQPDVIISQQMVVEVADKDIAAHLQCSIGEPLVKWERIYTDKNTGELLMGGRYYNPHKHFKLEFCCPTLDLEKTSVDLRVPYLKT